MQPTLSGSSSQISAYADISSVCDTVIKKIVCPRTTCFIDRVQGGSVRYKYVTDISNLTYLFTDLPNCFRQNTIFLQCILYIQ